VAFSSQGINQEGAWISTRLDIIFMPSITIAGGAIDQVPACTILVKDEQTLQLGETTVRCLLTPGHTRICSRHLQNRPMSLRFLSNFDLRGDDRLHIFSKLRAPWSSLRSLSKHDIAPTSFAQKKMSSSTLHAGTLLEFLTMQFKIDL